MVTIFVLPAFWSTQDPNVTGGYISNYYMVQAASKVSEAYVVAPKATVTQDGVLGGVTIIRQNMGAPTGVLGRLRIIKELREPVLRILSEHPGARVKMFFSTTTIPLLPEFSADPRVETHVICRAYEDFIYGHWNPAAESWARTVIKRWVDNGRTAAGYLAADSIIVNSKWMASAVRRSFSERCITDVLYPPLDLYGSSQAPDKFDGNVVFIGRGRDKGHDVVEMLSEEFPGMTFHVFGSMNMRSRRNLLMYGWKPREEIFSKGSLCLVPSRWPEPFGRVAIEAQAYGLPVLASKVGGLSEAVFDQDLLIDSGSAKAWVSGLSRFQNGSERYYSDLGRREEFVRREFSLEKHQEAVKRICAL